MAIPATNLSASFEKLVHLGLKKILETDDINYKKFTIVKESQVKDK